MRNSVHKSNEESAVIREYADIAPHYDRRWASYITATLRETQKRLDIKPTDRLLDIGCGTVHYSRQFLKNTLLST